jgi:hypothetical protein
MLGTDTFTFQEFMVGETLPLAHIQAEVLNFLRERDDAVVAGAQAVNAYVPEPRMSQDVDLISPRAANLTAELRDHLADHFAIAVRVRELREGRGFRLYQVRKEGNRHLVDIRPAASMPPARRIADVLVLEPDELIAQKVIAYQGRQGQPKSGTDWRDIAALLLAFPELKRDPGPVTDRLEAAGADDGVLARWRALVAEDLRAEPDDAEFD